MDFNAIVVSGGRSSRLGGTPKAGLSNGRQTLLGSTLAAVDSAAQTVVVGPETLPVPAHVILTREDPPFSGPAAALAAGLAALPADSAAWTLLLAVDMPAVARAVEVLVDAAAAADEATVGFAGVVEGSFQPLAGIYRTEALRRAFSGETENKSVRRLLGALDYETLELPAGSTDDVDTWDSARSLGFSQPTF
ncbi:molybdenum cofactor guanylyltransferase [Rothia aerolata]|uniref:MobA-like NTP transferase domain-containing protein n=1 Tax=Rothia aerolata TaxID=1812262 RepID=A0A917IPP5_9MICC|nr:NTP transferase domain-containing protein [Rothia aerolata]GGH60692.1 hypothetical protein GCM10007359_09120 [Rothia aerolata]